MKKLRVLIYKDPTIFIVMRPLQRAEELTNITFNTVIGIEKE